ncbi:Cytochrome P450 superfamily protein [Prunus dulcis]|uniref:Cytochrome P450 superfamily protein n=1 Tax=Prunus dulcis TaxID=3755 RepID=A0A5H2XQY5_PRUDU|nr:Cytochrome P450 superfamily protein [Prunus dulcis]
METTGATSAASPPSRSSPPPASTHSPAPEMIKSSSYCASSHKTRGAQVSDIRPAYNITMTMVAGKRYYGDDDVADKEEARRFIEIMEQAVAYTTLPKPGDVFHWINIFWGV